MNSESWQRKEPVTGFCILDYNHLDNSVFVEVKIIKNKYVAFVLFVIAFLAFWNLADYLYTTFITNGAYHFAVGTDGAIPVVAIVSGYLLFVRKKSD